MTPRTKTGRRALLATAAIAAPVLGGAHAAAGAPDARLMALATDLRQAEGEYYTLVCREDDARDRKAERVASDRIEEIIGAMADIPAEGLPGIAAKAGRICWSLEAHQGGSLMYCEDVLAESLAADLARLVPHAVGVQA